MRVYHVGINPPLLERGNQKQRQEQTKTIWNLNIIFPAQVFKRQWKLQDFQMANNTTQQRSLSLCAGIPHRWIYRDKYATFFSRKICHSTSPRYDIFSVLFLFFFEDIILIFLLKLQPYGCFETWTYILLIPFFNVLEASLTGSGGKILLDGDNAYKSMWCGSTSINAWMRDIE